jgi:Arc/MetJ-type ribon-helix-helix transcriptional regulator
MHINLPPNIEESIMQMVRDGRYRDFSEAMNDAALMLCEFQKKSVKITEALSKGESDIEKGKITEYSREFLKNSYDAAREIINSGTKLKPDVLP